MLEKISVGSTVIVTILTIEIPLLNKLGLINVNIKRIIEIETPRMVYIGSVIEKMTKTASIIQSIKLSGRLSKIFISICFFRLVFCSVVYKL